MIKKIVSLTVGCRVSGFIVLVLLVISNALMKPRLPLRKDTPDYQKPDVKGILLDVPYLFVIASACFIFWGLLFPCEIYPSFEIPSLTARSLLLAALCRRTWSRSNYCFESCKLLRYLITISYL